MSKDFAEGLYEGSNEGDIPRNEHGGLRVMAVLAPSKTSREHEERSRRLVDTSDVEILFLDEDNEVEIAPLTSAERAALRKQGFTDQQIDELERITS